MSCPTTEKWTDLISGRIRGAEERALDLHLVNCAHCQVIVRALRRIRNPNLSDTQPVARAPELPCEQEFHEDAAKHSDTSIDFSKTASRDTPISAEEFWPLVVASRLIENQTLRDLYDSLDDSIRYNTQRLAQELMDRGLLTKYQASQLRQGRRKGLILADYVVLDQLGKGGNGMVFKAKHRRTHQIVALKVLHPQVSNNPPLVKRFQREVVAASQLNHPNIVRAFDSGQGRGVHYLVMEFVDGRDLAELVLKKGPMPFDQAVACLLQTAHGLVYAHAQGVVHRDIKPANLLLDPERRIKILDMGLARMLRPDDETDMDPDSSPSNDNLVIGTADYMAPEQASDPKSADQRVDIYSLGCTLHYLLTAKPVYDLPTRHEVIMAHQLEPIPSLKALRPETPEALDAFFKKTINKSPEERQPDMAAAAAELQKLAAIFAESSSWIRLATAWLKG